MEKFFLERPSMERKDEIIQYFNEFVDNNSEINGTGSLDLFLEGYTFEEAFERCMNLENKEYANLEKHGKDFEYYKQSLPHRTDAEIKEIMKTYIGCITWSELAQKFPELKEKFVDN